MKTKRLRVVFEKVYTCKNKEDERVVDETVMALRQLSTLLSLPLTVWIQEEKIL